MDVRPTRRSLLAAAVTSGIGLITGAPAAARPSGFVTAGRGGLRAAGKPFRFGGTNCYYLHQQSHYMIDSLLNDAAAMGLPVVRAWAFADGTARALQPKPYEYDDAAFDSLDYAVHKAGQLGIRLVLPLVNNWPDYGGMQQYVRWFLGLSDDTYGDCVNHDRFYDEPSIRDCYRAYARHVTGRRNRYTALRYNEDPTIMTFELGNEPRCRSDKSGARLLSWVKEMSAYVKELAPHQLVAVGDEGFYGDPANADYPYSDYEGVRWKDLVALPTVDYGTVHLYPQGWGERTDPAGWGTEWIGSHLRAGRALGKPVVLEEYGVSVDAARGIPDVAARDATYRAWTSTVADQGGAGDQFWLLTSRVDDGSFYPDYDGYRICWDNDVANASNSTAHLLGEHARAMAGS
jgi:mannan endo-1,4-beta-mannosidase